MNKTQLIDHVANDNEYLLMCKKIVKDSTYKDLYQDLIIELHELKDEKIESIECIPCYVHRMLCNMVFSKTNKYYYTYKQRVSEADYKHFLKTESSYDKNIDTFANKTNQIIDSLHWYDKEIFKLYLDKENKSEVSRSTKIHSKAIERTINKVKTEIKIRLKMPIKILLLVQKNTTALQYHRQLIPHERLIKTHSGQFEIHQKIANEGGEAIIDDITDEQLKEYSIVSFLRQISFDRDRIERTLTRLKSLGIKVVLDIDDYWELPKTHFWYKTYNDNNVAANTIASLSKVDYVTTTTDDFRSHISDHNHRTTVLPNCISPDDKQWNQRKINTTNRIRLGWIGGVFHKNDLMLFEHSIDKLYHASDVKDKWQLCLGGFNPNVEYKAIEHLMTNRYGFKITDSTYYKYLQQYTPAMEHISFDKCYRRLWGKDIYNYGSLYNEIDVALIPLHDDKFNACKSELKIVEAGWMNKAVIVSDVSPYKQFIKHGKNGLVVKPSRNNIDWYVMMRKLILNPTMIEDLGNELNITIKKYFDIDEHNNKRAELYKSLVV